MSPKATLTTPAIGPLMLALLQREQAHADRRMPRVWHDRARRGMLPPKVYR